MRNLLNSMMRFTWAMPLFGMRQIGNMFGEPDSAARAFDSVTGTVQSELDQSTKSVFQTGDNVQRWMMQTVLDVNPIDQTLRRAPAPPSAPGLEARSPDRLSVDPLEATIVTISAGNATVRHGIDGLTHFIVHGQLEGMNGASEGEFEGVWSAKAFTPQDLVSYPERPLPPFDRPFKPAEQGWNPQLNFAKARWTFDRGWLEAVGPALSRIQINSDGQTQFWYSVAAFVTGGGGAYKGFRGQATSLGSAHFPAPPQPLEALSFKLNSVHVLKVMPQR